MKKLLERAASLSAGAFPKIVCCTWPIGKVVLYRDRIVLDARAERYELLYSDIDCFQFNLFQANIEHRQPNVVKDISINGFFVARAIKRAIRQYDLPITVR
jgi:hypothetical protein